MATDPGVLGFGNKWYAEGFNNAVEYKIDQQNTINVFSAPYFIASKLEAFKSPSRHDNNNGITSSDFEDIVFVLENRPSIWKEFEESPQTVHEYLKSEFSRLMMNSRFEEWIDAHAGFGSPPASNFIMDQLKKFVSK